MTEPRRPSIRIGEREIGDDHPVYFVADIAANHDGDLSRAIELVHRCAEAGADAAKFQNFQAHSIVSDLGFRKLGAMAHQAAWNKSVFEVYRDASLDLDWSETLREACRAAGIEYLTTPYALDIVDRLSPLVRAWKLGSGDITWHALIDRLACDGKPLLIATGASDMAEVEAAVAVARARRAPIVLMQCNTNYTGSVENFRHIALNVLHRYARCFPDVVLGLSDHTPGHATVLGAVALGARVIEKHFTDDRRRKGPDHPFSMDPASWRDMVERSRELEAALGSDEKRVMDNERESCIVQRRALRAAHPLAAHTRITATDLVALRPCPAGAVPPHQAASLIGRTLARAIPAGDLVTAADLAP